MFRALMNRIRPGEERVDELLSAYIDGMLTPHDRTSLEARLEQEPALRQRLEGLRLTVNALAELPHVGAPRNFILSPSMVAPPRPARRTSQRQTWPVFGWATAAATLVFLLVFAGDLFFVSPSQRGQAEDIVAQAQTLDVTPEVERAAAVAPAPSQMEEDLTASAPREEKAAAEAVPEQDAEIGMAEMEATVPASGEQQAWPVAEAPEELVEPEVLLEEAREVAVEGEAEGTATAPPAALAAEAREEPVTEEASAAAFGSPVPSPPALEAELRGTTAPGEASQETAVVTTTIPALLATPMPGEQPLVPSSTIELLEPGGDAESLALQDQMLILTPPAVAAAPPEGTLQGADIEQVKEGVPGWLRLLEVVLGASVIGLATATLILRWREA